MNETQNGLHNRAGDMQNEPSREVPRDAAPSTPRTMRWHVEVTSMDKADTTSVIVEAQSWQRALQAARASRGESGPISGFSIELLDEGYRAVDPLGRLRYDVTRAVDDEVTTTISVPQPGTAGAPQVAPLAPAAPAPPAAPAAQAAPPRPAPIPAPPPGDEAKGATPSRKPLAAAPAPAPAPVGMSSSSSPKPAPIPAPPKMEPTPPSRAPVVAPMPIVSVGAANGPLPAANPAMNGGLAATTLETDALVEVPDVPEPPPFVPAATAPMAPPAAPPAAPTQMMAFGAVTEPLQAIPDGPIPPTQVVFKREHDPTERLPLTYREYVYSVARGVDEAAGERLLRSQLDQVRASIASARPGKFVNLAVFDVVFQGRPPVPPLATLAWKDWRGEPQVVFPRRGAHAPAAARPAAAPPSARPPAPVQPPAPLFAPPAPVQPPAPVFAPPAPQVPPAPVGGFPPAVVAAPAFQPPPPQAPSFPVPAPAPVFAPPPAQVMAPPPVAPVFAPPPPAPVFAPPPPAPPVHDQPPQAQPPPAFAPAAAAPAFPVAAAPVFAPPPPVAPAAPAPVMAPQPMSAPPQPLANSPFLAPVDPFAAPPAPTPPPPAATPFTAATGARRPSDSFRTAALRGSSPRHPTPSRPSFRQTVGRRATGDELIANLFEAMHELQFARDVIEGGDYVLALALEMIPSRIALVHLYDIDRREYVVACVAGQGAEALLNRRHAESEPLLSAAMRKRRAIVASDASTDENVRSAERFGVVGGAASAIVSPVMQGGRFIGVIEVVNPLDGSPFTEDEGNAVDYISEQFGEFVSNHGMMLDPARITRSQPPSM